MSVSETHVADQVADPIGDRIDWGLAASTGKRLTRPGPKITAYTRDAAFAELDEAARRAEGPVRAITGLADGLPIPTARILDLSLIHI